MSLKTLLHNVAKPLLESQLMSAPLEERASSHPSIDIPELVNDFIVVKLLNEATEERMKELRQILLEAVEKFGKGTDRGGQKLVIDGTLVRRETRRAALPDDKELKTLLLDRGIDFEEVFTRVTSVVLDASKLKNLIDLGKLPEDKVNAMKKVTWALRVIPSDEAAELIESTLKGPEPLPNVSPRSKRANAVGSRKE